jgi:hypothetical protein
MSCTRARVAVQSTDRTQFDEATVILGHYYLCYKSMVTDKCFPPSCHPCRKIQRNECERGQQILGYTFVHETHERQRLKLKSTGPDGILTTGLILHHVLRLNVLRPPLNANGKISCCTRMKKEYIARGKLRSAGFPLFEELIHPRIPGAQGKSVLP